MEEPTAPTAGDKDKAGRKLMPVWPGRRWEERCVHSRRQEGKLQLRNNTALENTVFLSSKELERNVKRSDGHKEKNIYKLKHVILSKFKIK